MFSKAIQLAKGSIFPIIASGIKDGKVQGMQVAGSGFFIDEQGHFVTAYHVVSGKADKVRYGSLGNIPYARFKNVKPEPIQTIGFNKELDLFVGKVDNNILPGLKLRSEKPLEGSSIVIGGYPFPNIMKTKEGNLNFITVRQYWQSTMIMDYVNMSFFSKKMKYDGFLVDKRTIPGMSGGPALNLNGEIIGMCTAQITRAAKDKVANINGVCLDAEKLSSGINRIFEEFTAV